jgi:serine protease DegQ
MTRFPLLLLQLALAALVGYVGARYAITSAPAPAAPPSALPAPPPAAPVPMTPPVAVDPNSVPRGSYRVAVERAGASVVTVHSARTAARGPFGLGGRQVLSQGLGSGVVIDSDGDVVTNNHVVEGANELAVALPDGTLRPTQLVGVDPDSDLALLKIEGNGLKPIAVGDIKGLAVGDVVLAVGNPLGVGQTVTQGIVSALGRKGIGINPIENFIQTDAAINPGNSGGALIDTSGRLIGINSAILSRGGGSEGIGFAIPIDIAQKVIASLKKNGRVARGWLGISTTQVPRGQPGALVVAVQRGAPADRAGIVPGDVIVGFGDQRVEQPEDVAGATLELEPGTRVALDVVRDGKHRTLDVTLGTRPSLRRDGARR